MITIIFIDLHLILSQFTFNLEHNQVTKLLLFSSSNLDGSLNNSNITNFVCMKKKVKSSEVDNKI